MSQIIEKNTVINLAGHPMVDHLTSEMIDTKTSPSRFRAAARLATAEVLFACARFLHSKEETVETRMGRSRASFVKDKVAVIPVLRAGIAMAEVATQFFPDAPIAFSGIKRDHDTQRPIPYRPVDKVKVEIAIVVDPMLATGGSMHSTIEEVASLGVETIIGACLFAVPEGAAKVHEDFPHVPVVTALMCDGLDENGYIHIGTDKAPNRDNFLSSGGLGDFGDIFFGTEALG